MTATRRLAAILAADVSGYPRLIGADEGGTLQALKAIRVELIDPTIAAHNGRLVKTTGDGLLIEFSSVVDALRCATEVQAGMAERNTAVPNDKRIEFRIGINVGDIVVENGDIFGDGVNVAARLEGLAEPGGICVSARVQEDAAGKLDLAFEDLGEQTLKVNWSKDRDAPMADCFKNELVPRLADVRPVDIQQATGLSASFVLFVRNGKRLPHPRWQRALAILTRVEYPFKDHNCGGKR